MRRWLSIVSAIALVLAQAQTSFAAITAQVGPVPGWGPLIAPNLVLYCTGGNSVANSGTTRVHQFTSSGTLSCSGKGTANYLIVGGGAGGAYGGGAAGGVLSGTITLSATGYAITVGAAGSAGTLTSAGTSGGNSAAFSLTAVGGGTAGYDLSGHQNGSSGGSGGGAACPTTGSGGAATAGQGNVGGSCSATGNSGGGGGGCAGAGGAGSGVTSGIGGNGGAPCSESLPGFSGSVAGGGGGFGSGGGGAGGGAGAGSQGSSCSSPNSGSGGGAEGAGCAGIVVVTYSIAWGEYCATQNCGDVIADRWRDLPRSANDNIHLRLTA